jgi:hypothetical protein
MMESNRERTSGKIAGPGWVNLPIGSLIERKKKQIPTKRGSCKSKFLIQKG